MTGEPFASEVERLGRPSYAVRAGVSGVAASVRAVAAAAGRRLSRRDRIPYVGQSDPRDCAAACVSMVLGWHGAGADDVAERLGVGRDGVRVRTIVDVATELGLEARGVRIPPERVEQIPAGAILHVDGNHFLVVARPPRRGRVLVHDPAAGPLWLPLDTLRARFGGVAVVVAPPAVRVKRPAVLSLWQLAGFVLRPGDHRRGWIRAVVASVVVQVLGLVVPLLTRVVVDEWAGGRTDTRVALAATAGFAVACFAIAVTRTLATVSLQSAVERHVTTRLVRHALGLPYRFFQSRDPGDLLLRLRSATGLREMLSTVVITGALDGVTALLFLALIVTQDPWLALLVAASGALQVLLAVGASLRVLEATRASLAAQSRSQGELLGFLNGAQTVKIAGSEQAVLDRWTPVFHDELRADLVRQRFVGVCLAIVGTLRTVTPLAVLVLGITRVQQGEITLGALLAANALAVGFVAPLGSLSGTAVMLPLLRGHLERMGDVLRARPDPDGDGQLERFAGRVAAEGVSFRYGRYSPEVVRDVTLDVPAGEKVAVVGPSGSGKSTLALVVAGLHRPTAGRVTFDGTDVADYAGASVRRAVAVVTQQAYVFAGTVRDNLQVEAPGASDEELLAACRFAEFADVLAGLPMGLDTRLDSGGSMLSGGQRQRLVLARAMVRPRPLLILDEATSALDAETERRIMERVLALPATVVFVAHRLSTVRYADRVVVMESGRVVEAGRPEALVAAGGRFADLVAGQTGPRAGLARETT